LFRPRERAFKQFKCPRPQCVKESTSLLKYDAMSMVNIYRRLEKLAPHMPSNHVFIAN